MKIISKYFPELNHQQSEQFVMLGKLYLDWNNKINLISKKDIHNLYAHHILHSLSIAKIITFSQRTKIIDIGTGGGLPGIPLAIMFPDSHFYLVDSIAKKINVVKSITEELNLKNITAINGRAEQINDKFDFVLSRAVTKIPMMYDWMKNKILLKNRNKLLNGLICLKGGDLTDELQGFRYKSFDISDFYEEEYFQDKKIINVNCEL